jgi:hypothetical protein
MVSSKKMRFKELADGEEFAMPCGFVFLSVAGKTVDDSFDMFYSASPTEGIFECKRPFAIGGVGSIFSSENTDPKELTIKANGNVQIVYVP